MYNYVLNTANVICTLEKKYNNLNLNLEILISKALSMAHVNEESYSFTCHPHVYPRMESAILPLFPAAEHRLTLDGTHFLSR